MTAVMKTIEVKVERTISAPPGEVFDAWLDSEDSRHSLEYG